MGNQKSAKKSASETGDYEAVRESILLAMDAPEHDDGSYAPVLIRLGWHSSGTFIKDNKDPNVPTGGSSGATMRYELEMKDPENNGLEVARKLLEPIKAEHPWISYADLWILAAYAAIEHTGGPFIKFNPGRLDKAEKDAVPPGRLPVAEYGILPGIDEQGRANGWENCAAHIREVFYRMGFDDREIVALLSGGHVYGRCHPEHTGYAGAWVTEPTKFQNEYAADLIDDPWTHVETKNGECKVDGEDVPLEVRPAEGKRQYTNWVPSTRAEPEEEEEEEEPIPDIESLTVGRFEVVDGWINVRRTHLPDSFVIDQPKKGKVFNVVALRKNGKGLRGQLDVGGWASIVSTDGDTALMRRVGDIDFSLGEEAAFHFRLTPQGKDEGKGKIFDSASADAKEIGKVDTPDVYVSEVVHAEGVGFFGLIAPVEQNSTAFVGKYVLLVDNEFGSAFDKIVKGYNETPRKAIKKLQVKHQMMLVSDMVMLWDEKFKEHLKKYAEDEELLKKEFGEAYQKLCELGVPGCPFAK